MSFIHISDCSSFFVFLIFVSFLNISCSLFWLYIHRPPFLSNTTWYSPRLASQFCAFFLFSFLGGGGYGVLFLSDVWPSPTSSPTWRDGAQENGRSKLARGHAVHTLKLTLLPRVPMKRQQLLSYGEADTVPTSPVHAWIWIWLELMRVSCFCMGTYFPHCKFLIEYCSIIISII